MQIECAKIEVTARLLLSAREVELLRNLFSYGIEDYVKQITPNSYEGGVEQEEMLAFVSSIKDAAGHARASINEHAKKGLIL